MRIIKLSCLLYLLTFSVALSVSQNKLKRVDYCFTHGCKLFFHSANVLKFVFIKTRLQTVTFF